MKPNLNSQFQLKHPAEEVLLSWKNILMLWSDVMLSIKDLGKMKFFTKMWIILCLWFQFGKIKFLIWDNNNISLPKYRYCLFTSLYYFYFYYSKTGYNNSAWGLTCVWGLCFRENLRNFIIINFYLNLTQFQFEYFRLYYIIN